jgi:biopolymer transport protein ExbD
MQPRCGKATPAKVEQQMTPLIDIVFQLLVFFILSFKVVNAEGDFSLKMPLGAKPDPGMPPSCAPLKLRLIADQAGELMSVHLNQREFPAEDWSLLQRHLLGLLHTDSGPSIARPELEVEIDCDYRLHYQHAMDGVTAVSGMRGEHGQIVPLIERVKLAPPRSR